MKLELKKPIAFLDLETTGINIVTDRIVEISVLRIEPDGTENQKSYRINPTIPIPEKATAIHGITDDEVGDKPTFREIGPLLVKLLEGCDLAGYNCNKFDIPLLAEEFMRADIDFDVKNRRIIDVQVIFHKLEQRTLGAAYRFYCGKDLAGAHSAAADTYATYEILQSQLDLYKELDNNVDFLNKFSAHTKNADLAGRIVFDEKGKEMFNFGKYKGMPVEDVLQRDPSYYGWMMNGEFPHYTKKVLTGIKLRTFGK